MPQKKPKTPFYDQLREITKDLMFYQDWTQDIFAKKLKISQQTLSIWLNPNDGETPRIINPLVLEMIIKMAQEARIMVPDILHREAESIRKQRKKQAA